MSKQLSSIKLLIIFNALCMKGFTTFVLDAYHVKASFIAKAHYHAVLIDSQKDISEA